MHPVSGGHFARATVKRECQLKLERTHPNVFTLTVTGPELSGLIAAARLSLEVMRGDPAAPKEAISLLDRLLHDYDGALKRMEQ